MKQEQCVFLFNGIVSSRLTAVVASLVKMSRAKRDAIIQYKEHGTQRDGTVHGRMVKAKLPQAALNLRQVWELPSVQPGPVQRENS